MTDMNDINELRKIAEAWLDRQDLLLTNVIARLDAVGQKYHDGAVSTLHRVLQKRASKTVLITKSEFSRLWNEVSGLGDPEMFREEFSDMLNDSSSPLKERTDYSGLMGGLRDSGTALDLADPVRVAALEQAISPGKHKFGQAGQESIKADLLDAGFKGVGVHVALADNNFVVYAAEVDGRTGRRTFFLPAEIRKGSVLIPSVFYGNKYAELTQDNLQQWVDSPESSDGNPVVILNQLNNLVDAAPVTASDWGSVSSVTADSSVVVDMPEFTTPILPAEQAAVGPEAFATAGVDFEQILLESQLKYNPRIVATAKAAVSQELAVAGLQHDKMKIASVMDNGFALSMHVQGSGGRQHIVVPIEISASGTPLLPAVFHTAESAHNFDSATLRRVASADMANLEIAATSMQDMTFKQLYKQVLAATSAGSYRVAEECLAAIGERFGEDYHRAAMEDMIELIKAANSPQVTKSEFDKYYDKFEAEAADRDRDIKMTQNIRLIDTE